jgi:hypothetical protein
MVEKYNSIMRNDIWDIVSKPEGKLVVSSRWLYNIKHDTNGSIEKFKARLWREFSSQKEGMDYDETFSLVARYASIRVVISIALVMKWRIHQMDVKTTFLHEIIKEEVYIEKDQVFEVHGGDSHVCRLNKSLYKLKHAPKAWYYRIDGYL